VGNRDQAVGPLGCWLKPLRSPKDPNSIEIVLVQSHTIPIQYPYGVITSNLIGNWDMVLCTSGGIIQHSNNVGLLHNTYYIIYSTEYIVQST
jgi:hypothetical protein